MRFQELTSFTSFITHDLASETDPLSSAAVFAGLMDAISRPPRRHPRKDRRRTRRRCRTGCFAARQPKPAARRPPARESADLRMMLRRVGHSGDLASKIRDSLLRDRPDRAVRDASRRMAAARGQAAPRYGAPGRGVAQRLRRAHLVNKVQLLLDATLGLINVEQNNIIKVLTDRFGGRHPADPGRQHVRDEFQRHARAELGLGISLRPDGDRAQRGPAAGLVQIARLDIDPGSQRNKNAPERSGGVSPG